MITINITISFLVGLALGGVGGYTISIYLINKSQKTKGDKSPNVMGDQNSLKIK